MDIKFNRDSLLIAIDSVSGVVETRNTIPILSNVALAFCGGVVSFIASDLDMEARAEITADTSLSGRTTVDANIFKNVIRKLPVGCDVCVDINDDKFIISCVDSEFALSCLPYSDFPTMESDRYEHEFSIPKEDLRRLINKTKFAQSNESTRYYLNGLYFHIVAGSLATVATDGHRLGKYAVTCPDGAGGMSGVIIPRKTVAEALKMVDGEGDVSIKVSGTKIQFATGGMVLTSKLVDGTFPDYDRVIPKSNPNTLTVSVKALKDAVDRVSTVATDKTRAVKLSLGPGTLELSVVSVDSGTATETIPVDYNGEPMEIGCNAKYLLESLSVISGESVTFELDNSGSPMVIKDQSDSEFVGVLMPMRV